MYGYVRPNRGELRVRDYELFQVAYCGLCRALSRRYGFFARFAVNVWGITPDGKSDDAVADEGLAALEAWMREIGVAMNITELGATEEMLPKIADATFILTGGYKVLEREDVIKILRESL